MSEFFKLPYVSRKCVLLQSRFGMQVILDIMGSKQFSMLDIGAGNHSCTMFKYFFNTDYSGVDISTYNNDEDDMKKMTKYYEMDLTKLNFSEIPNEHFDLVHSAHCIEHLYNGTEVLTALLPKVAKNGFFYLEYPRIKSIYLPHKKGTLNFYDDDSHIRLYSMHELLNVFTQNGFKIVKFGNAGRIARTLYMPIRCFQNLFHGFGFKLNDNRYWWEALGFAEYILAQKL